MNRKTEADPRIEAAAKALYFHDVSNQSGPNAPEIIALCESAARAALAAADKVASLAPCDGRATPAAAELKAAKRVAKQHMNRAEKAESERDAKAEACRTMAHVIELQGRWAVEATGSQDLIGDDGDGDWDVVWDRVTELGDKARQASDSEARAILAEARASAAESKLALIDAWLAQGPRS